MPNEVISVAVGVEGLLGSQDVMRGLRLQPGETAAHRAKVEAYVRRAISTVGFTSRGDPRLEELCEFISLREIGRARGDVLGAIAIRHMKVDRRVAGEGGRVCIFELLPDFHNLTEFGAAAPKALLAASMVHLYSTSDEPVRVAAVSTQDPGLWDFALRELGSYPLSEAPEWAATGPVNIVSELKKYWALTPHSQALASSHVLRESAKLAHQSNATAKRNNRLIQLHINWPNSLNSVAGLPDLAAGRVQSNILPLIPTLASIAVGREIYECESNRP